MSRNARTVGLFAAGALTMASPYWAELWFEHRVAFFGAAAALASAALMLLTRTEQAWRTGVLGACAAAILAPAGAWPLLLLARVRHVGRPRPLWGAVAIGCAVAVGAAFGWDAVDRIELTDDFEGKAFEAINAAVFGLRLCHDVPFAGPSRNMGSFLAPCLVAAAAGLLVWCGRRGVLPERASRPFIALACAAILAPVVPAFLARPVNAAALAVLPAVVLTSIVLTAALLRRTTSVAGKVAVVALVAAVMTAIGTAEATEAADHWTGYASRDILWNRRLSEAHGPLYRLERASELRARGLTAAAEAEEAAYFDRPQANPTLRERRVLDLARRGRSPQFLRQWRMLPTDRRPTEGDDVRRVLETLRDVGERAEYFEFGTAAASKDPDILIALARTAEADGDTDSARRYVACALESEHPSVAAFELEYRFARNGQERARLTQIGKRALAIHPDAWIGDAALAKAAKLVRADDEMLKHAQRALYKRPEISELHYDVALVYHGREGCAKQAAEHYRRVIELQPDHPRRTFIELWIAALGDAL